MGWGKAARQEEKGEGREGGEEGGKKGRRSQRKEIETETERCGKNVGRAARCRGHAAMLLEQKGKNELSRGPRQHC